MIDTTPIDVGGMSWRHERMDESLTEDEFYSGPLRGVFNRLNQSCVLQYVQILVLDGLSVPADLVREIVCESRYNVRILSIRECKNLNQSKLQQVLRYAVRPTRPADTPKLRALYCFGSKDAAPVRQTGSSQGNTQHTATEGGITTVPGAQIGAQWNQLSSAVLSSSLPQDDQAKWYGRSGRVLQRPQSEWPDTLQVCRDIISFDAVLCRGVRHDITKVSSTDYIPPAIATVALGPEGCEICKSSPEGPAVYSKTDQSTLPLLAPPPRHTASLRAAQMPETYTEMMLPTSPSPSPPSLFLRCEECLRGRWCERCSRWWCESCYENVVSRMTAAQPATTTEALRENGWDSRGQGAPIKLGVHRDCFDCGRTCDDCSARYMRSCTWCSTAFCHLDDEGSTEKMCSWCSHSGRRTRELY